jgi:hypothetical protein
MRATKPSLVPMPSQKQPLRGHSPHPPPLSPTRGEGSKTLRLRLQLAGENKADRKLAQSQIASERMRAFFPLARWRERGPGGEGGDRATPSAETPYATPVSSTSVNNRSTPCPFAKATLSLTSSQSSCLAFSSLESKMTPSSHYAKIQKRVSW